MENPTYQRIFNAFKSSNISPQKSSAAKDFENFSAMPESMLHTLAIVRSIGTPQQFHFHKTTYLQALIHALNRPNWNQSHAKELIDIADWLISLYHRRPYSTNYLQKLRILRTKIQTKITVPKTKQQEWEQRIPHEKNYIPKTDVRPPAEFYGKTYHTARTQFLNTDDRD